MALIDKLSAIGNAIREKTGKTDLLTLDQMPAEIRSISGGGSSTSLYKFNDTITSPYEIESMGMRNMEGVEGSIEWDIIYPGLGAVNIALTFKDFTFVNATLGEIGMVFQVNGVKGQISNAEGQSVDIAEFIGESGTIILYTESLGWCLQNGVVEYTQPPTINITKCDNTEAEAWLLANTTPIGGGGGGGGSAELNIAYGDTPPTDTSKLWVKCSEPNKVVVSKDIGRASAEGESITTLPEVMSAENNGMGCASVGTKIYILNGQPGASWKKIFCYDTEARTYTTVNAEFDTPLSYAVCESIGTKIYHLSGNTANSSNSQRNYIYRFDTETEELTKLSATATTASHAGGAVCGNCIYMFGGIYNTTSSTPARYRNIVQMFYAETETASTLPVTLPVAMRSMGCECVGDKIYMFGGMDDSNCYDHIIRFDTSTYDMTTLEATLPYPNILCGTAALGDNIYLFGGGMSESANIIVRFDTKTETCEVIPADLGEGRSGMGVAVVGEKAYLFGGGSGETRTIIQCFYGKTETLVIESGTIHIRPQDTKNIFPIINTETTRVEIGVECVYKGNENNEGEPIEAALYKEGEWKTI